MENINLVPFFLWPFSPKILITCPFLVSAPCWNTPVAGVWGAVSDWSGSSWGQSQEDPGWSLLHTRDAEQSHQEVLRRLANESLSGQVSTGPSLSVEQLWCDESKPLEHRCQTPDRVGQTWPAVSLDLSREAKTKSLLELYIDIYRMTYIPGSGFFFIPSCVFPPQGFIHGTHSAHAGWTHQPPGPERRHLAQQVPNIFSIWRFLCQICAFIIYIYIFRKYDIVVHMNAALAFICSEFKSLFLKFSDFI